MSRTSTLIVASLGVLLFALVVNRGLRRANAPTASAGPALPGGVEVASSVVSKPRGTDKVRREAWSRAKGSADAGGAEPEPPPALLDWVDRMLKNQMSSPLTKEDLDHWFASGRTNAGDLLAARQAGEDARYLTNALEQFPNDPRVLIAATIFKDGPDAHRERLERLKTAAPDNPLADYLGAWNEFNAGNPDKALENLAAAAKKPRFDDYSVDAMQTTEELYLDAGKSPAEAKALVTATTPLPHLAQLKKLSQHIAELQGQYVAAGDNESAVRLARMGVQLGNHLTEGGGSQTLIGELVGIAIHKGVLKSLPPEANHDFLQGDVSAFLAGIEERRAAVRENMPNFEAWARNATEADILSYYDRLQVEGESAAMKWLREQTKKP